MKMLSVLTVLLTSVVHAELIDVYDVDGNVVDVDDIVSYETPYPEGYIADYIAVDGVDTITVKGITLCVTPEITGKADFTFDCKGNVSRHVSDSDDSSITGYSMSASAGKDFSIAEQVAVLEEAVITLDLPVSRLDNLKSSADILKKSGKSVTLEAMAPNNTIKKGNYTSWSWHYVGLLTKYSAVYRLDADQKVNGSSNTGFSERYLNSGTQWVESIDVGTTSYYSRSGHYQSTANSSYRGASEVGRTSGSGLIIVE
jgi:hypothetical protein